MLHKASHNSVVRAQANVRVLAICDFRCLRCFRANAALPYNLRFVLVGPYSIERNCKFLPLQNHVDVQSIVVLLQLL